MSRESRADLKCKSDRLLNGSLKHVRAAALAAVLVPLASVAATQAVAEQCSSSCPPPVTVPSPCDFITSGGFVLKDVSNTKVTFSAHGGCKHEDFWGHLNLTDHQTGLSVNSLEILGYFSGGPNIREICGTATTNQGGNQPVNFRVRLIDNGEPGVADQFGIALSGGYTISMRPLNGGQNGGGNVQLHEPNPSTSGPDPAPTAEQVCGGLVVP